MASVKKFPRSRFWSACFTHADGRRVQRSTGLTDRDDALRVAVSWEKAARAAREGRFAQDQSRRLLREIDALTGGGGGGEAAGVFLEGWLKAHARTLKPKSADKFRGAVRLFLDWLGPERAARGVGEIGRAEVAAWRDFLLAEGRAPATVNTLVAVIGQGFREACRRGLAERNPAEGLRLRKTRRADAGRRPFTPEQYRALLKAAEGEWKWFIRLLAETGGRQQEIAQLKRGDADPAGRRLWLTRGKTGDRLEIPLLEETARGLAARLKAEPGGPEDPLLPQIAAREGKALSKFFRLELLPKIGLARPYGKKKGAGREVAPYSLHSLRHSLATWLNRAGVPDATRRKILGHESAEISRGYTHAGLDEARKALRRAMAEGGES